MKIVHIIDSLGRGGAETILVGVVNGLSEHENIIITLKPINDFKEQYIGAKIISLYCTPLWKIPIAIFRLKKYLRAIKPDIIHSHLFWSSIVAKLAVAKTDKLFYTNHCIQSFAAFSNRILLVLEKITYSNRFTLISVSKTVEEDYFKYINVTGKHHVLYNFVDDQYFAVKRKEIGINSLKALAVGRLSAQKNYLYLLDAINKAKFDIQMDIFGEGIEYETLKNRILMYNLKNVNLNGVHPNIYIVLSEYNLFIMSSIYEGLPVSLLEAMAAGLPLLLSDIPVLREVAEDAALYFDLNNSDSLTTILQDIHMGKISLTDLALKSKKRALEIAGKSEYLEKLTLIYIS